jgi:hypothetical protein
LNQAGDKKHFPFVIFHFSFVIDSRIRLAPGQHFRVDVEEDPLPHKQYWKFLPMANEK